MTIEEIKRIAVLELRPDDAIVVESDEDLEPKQILIIKNLIGDAFPGRKVIVCPKGFRLAAVRSAA